MNHRHTLLGAIILAAVLLGGTWLFVQRMPMTQEARERQCIEVQRKVRSTALYRENLPLEELEAATLAYCDCFAREVSRRLTPEELATIDRKQSTPAIDAKLAEVVKECRPKTP